MQSSTLSVSVADKSVCSVYLSMTQSSGHTTSAKQLHLDAIRAHSLGSQLALHIQHERLGTTHVVLRCGIVQEQVLLEIQLAQVQATGKVVVFTLFVLGSRVAGEEEGLQVRHLGGQLADLGLEGTGGGGASAVNEGDFALCLRLGLEEGVQDRGERGQTHTGCQENDGAGALLLRIGQEEVTLGVRHLDDVAFLLEIVQDVRHEARVGFSTRFGGIKASLLLHRDPVVVGAGLVTERVLSGLRVVELGDEELDGNVLSGTERGKGLAINRLEVEGGDLGRFRHLLGNAEIAELGPSVGLLVEGRFAVDHDISELEVSGGPRVLDGGGEGVTKDFAHGLEQELADDVVVLGLDVEGGMLVADELDCGAESTKVVDVGGVGEDSAGEGAGLVAVHLVG